MGREETVSYFVYTKQSRFGVGYVVAYSKLNITLFPSHSIYANSYSKGINSRSDLLVTLALL